MVAFFNLWQLLLKGGPMIWPLLLLSVLALSVGLEKIFYLISYEKSFRSNKDKLFENLKKENIKQVVTMCEDLSGSFSHILKAGLLNFGHSKEAISAAMQEIYVYEVCRLKERMSILSFVINVSVLIGLLGTVIGLMVVFHSVQVRSNVLNPLSLGDVAVGIWQALFVTVLGLMVCILSFAVYSYCAARINNIIADLDIAKHQALHMLIQLAQSKEDPREE